MGGQGVERREILRYIGIASVAASFPGFRRWAFACAPDHAPGALPQTVPTPYRPLFFSHEHYLLVERIAEMIIPADDSPGAKEAGVAEFIDFAVANRVAVSPGCEIRSVQDAIRQGDDAQVQFMAGLGWIDSHSKAEFGSHFLEATSQQQTSLLEELAYKAKFKPTTEMGREFFRLMRDYTVVGYYTTKIGLETLGYPGLRKAWPSMPGCTHLDDPEHLHLKMSAEDAGRDGKSAG